MGPFKRGTPVELAGKAILVTGGGGLVGSHIVDELVKARAHVVVYDSFIRGKKEHLTWARGQGEVRVIEGDIRDRESLNAAIHGVEYVFHQAAAWLRMCQTDPRLSVDVN